MRILINGNEGLVTAQEGSTLGGILTQLNEWLGGHGFGVQSIRLDGEELTTERRSELAEVGVTRFDRLEASVVRIEDLARSVLAEIEAHLPALRRRMAGIGERINSGRHAAGLSELSGTIEALQLVFDGVSSISRVFVDAGKVALDSFGTDLETLLGDLDQALRDRDMVTTADLVEYEIAPLLEALGSGLERLRCEVAVEG